MRREDITLDVTAVDWIDTDEDPQRPSVTIDCSGGGEGLRERLTGPNGELLGDEETDVSLRLHDEMGADTKGVVSMTERFTGDFIMELNVDADDVIRFITAARRYAEQSNVEDGQYTVTICVDGEELVTYEKRTFLVYDESGKLLRNLSLIPGGVEL